MVSETVWYALLALREQPMFQHQLEKRMEEMSQGEALTNIRRSLPDVLKTLERDGLIKRGEQNRPGSNYRRQYLITATGVNQLRLYQDSLERMLKAVPKYIIDRIEEDKEFRREMWEMWRFLTEEEERRQLMGLDSADYYTGKGVE